MAWSRDLAAKYSWHEFGRDWDLLGANEESAIAFLQGLDLFQCALEADPAKADMMKVCTSLHETADQIVRDSMNGDFPTSTCT
jgi:hypothetical protein